LTHGIEFDQADGAKHRVAAIVCPADEFDGT
jgi:hypothetical protein